jgi:hypothetical protein
LLRSPCSPPTEVEERRTKEFTKDTDRMILGIASSREDVKAVIPSASLCADAACITSLNDEFLYRDASHIRRNLSEETKRQFADLIGLTAALRAEPSERAEGTSVTSSR